MPESKNPQDANPVTSQPERKKSWLRRYVSIAPIVCIALAAYLLFFSDYSISKRSEYQQTIDSLSVQLKIEQDSLAYYRDLNRRLMSDPELMEQVVREQYDMKRPHEDVYIIEK